MSGDAAGNRVPAVAPTPERPRLRRVLMVRLSALGDVAHALPLAEALRAGLGPSVFLGWAVRSRFAELLHGNPHLDAVYELPGTGARAVAAFGKRLRGEQYDAALDAQGLLLSGVVTRLSGAPLRIGLDRNREGNRLFLTHPIVPGRERTHFASKLLGFCDALGIPRLTPRPQTYLAEAEAEPARALLAEAGDGGPRVALILGASNPYKTWPVERWAAATRLLADQGARVVLLGAPDERSTAARVCEEARGCVAASLAGRTTLRMLAAVLAQCDVVIGGDTGPTHLAVAVGTPVVGLYGVTDPALTGPNWGPAPATVLDFAEQDSPPERRRPRHPTLLDALARIPAAAAARAALALLEPISTARERRLEPFRP
jgi:heptosyltransferase I